MKRPYISGPMTGYEHHNFPAFYRAANDLKCAGYEPLNPAAMSHVPGVMHDTWQDAYHGALVDPQTWEFYIKRDIQMVLDSDGIVLLSGWAKSKGACLEVITSICIGNPVMTYHPHDPDWRAEFTLKHVPKEEAYRTALAHLDLCQTGNTSVPIDGTVLYS